MDEPDYAKIMHAIGRTLRDQYAGMLKEAFPSQLAELLLRLEQRLEADLPPKAPEYEPQGDRQNPGPISP